MQNVAGVGQVATRRLGLNAAIRLAPLAWILGCGAETPDNGGNPNAAATGGGGMGGIAASGGAPMQAGGVGGGSAAGNAGVVAAGVGGVVVAGSGGSTVAGGGGVSGSGMGGAGDGGAGTEGGAGGSAGTAGSDAGGGTGGTMEPVSYPMLTADAIGSPTMIKDGFTLAESPLWDPCGNQLLFTDVQGGTGSGGVIHTLSASGELGVLATNTTNANGIAYDIDGSLILSQMGGGGHLARRKKDGMIETIEPAGGPNLHTPDDVIVRSDGTIYFSDGNFYPIGSLLGFDDPLPVFVLKPGATALENGGIVGGPNGIEFSPDEKTLYVSAYGEGIVYGFSVAADGSITKGAGVVTGMTNPDSLCLDAAGNFYIGVQTGLQVASANGSKIKLVPIPGSSGTNGTTSCTFGGEDGKTLYVTNWARIFKIENMPIPGNDWLVNKQRVACN